MSDTAFLFPGQGSQFSGMGKHIAQKFPVARLVFEEADDILGFSLSHLCFHGPEKELRRTEYTQPAVLSTSIAAFRVLLEHGYCPSFAAGHSLGEYSALVAAGVLNFADAVRLVSKRGYFMQEAVPHGVGAMAALLRLPDGKLDQILSEAAQGQVVAAANYNSPDQIVIAGHSEAVERAMDLAKHAGAKRSILLPVSAPFHCALMEPAQQQMCELLESTPFSDPKFPIVTNWQAKTVTTAAEAREGLYHQIPSPVRWTDSILEIVRHGAKRYLEVGPGSVLGGLCKSIAPSLQGSPFGEPSDLFKVKALLGKPQTDLAMSTMSANMP
jgi:[acyl-carrier-protein] S-malonyltransferase